MTATTPIADIRSRLEVALAELSAEQRSPGVSEARDHLQSALQCVGADAAESVLGSLRAALGLLQSPEHLGKGAIETALEATAAALRAAVQLKGTQRQHGHPEQTPSTLASRSGPPQSDRAVGGRPEASPAKPGAATTEPPGATADPAPEPQRPTVGSVENHLGHDAAAPELSAEQEATSERGEPSEPSELDATDPPTRTLEVSLGAHSASNFFVGLGGVDVVSEGGLFVGTYQLPSVGERLGLTIMLPGGYAFGAVGEVTWLRPARLAGAEHSEPPGFGARLSEVSSEGRGLIERYLRNREPLLHGDF